MLQGKLQDAINKFDGLVRVREETSTWDKVVAKRGKAKRLNSGCSIRLATPAIDQQLTEKSTTESKAISTLVQLRKAHEANEKGSNLPTPIFQDDSEISEREPIIYSSASTGYSSDQRVIIDHIPVREQTDVDAATKDVRDLARALSKVDPTPFGLLLCQRVIKVRNPSTKEMERLDFIFSIPPELGQTVPRSLLAMSLARSVMFLHSSRFVRKSISPEDIVVLQISPGELGTPFWPALSRSALLKVELTCLAMPFGKRTYTDIPDAKDSIQTISTQCDMIFIASEYLIAAKDRRKAVIEIKATLVETARSRLPELMGKIYTDVVMSCLTCLDKNNEGFGDETEDEILVGVRYIEKILFEIEKIIV